MALCLWALCFLSALAVILAYQVRQRLELVKRLDQRDTLAFIADAALKRAISVIRKEPQDSYDFLQEEWSDNPSVFKEIRAGRGFFSVCYNDVEDGDGSGGIITRYGLIDEERKVNLNSAPQEAIERLLLLGLGMDQMQAQELAASIKDWIDPDSELSIPLGSAEDSHYRGLKYPYEAKDGDLEALDELLLVNGMTKDIYERIKDYVTIWGSGMVNVNTAGREALLAVGLSQALADKILSFRGLGDSQPAGYFSSLSDVSSKISQAYSLSGSELAQLEQAGRFLTVSSSAFMVKAVLRPATGGPAQEVLSVIDREGRVLYWKEP